MNLPNTYTNTNETGCCAVPDVSAWDEREIIFEDQHFIRMYTRSFLFIPLNMNKVMTRLQEAAQQADVEVSSNQAMTLSRDLSPWKAEHLYKVSRSVPGADNVTLNETYLTKVFEGSYSETEKWYASMQEFVNESDQEAKKTYFFYTTCPKCAKQYGKNYVIGLAEIAT